MRKFEQLNLFSKTLQSAVLVAHDSPRQAFYRIWIEGNAGDIRIVKESGVGGIKGRVLDRRSWPAENLDAAQVLFQRRIKSKTNQDRKCPRKFKLVQADEYDKCKSAVRSAKITIDQSHPRGYVSPRFNFRAPVAAARAANP